MSAAGFPVTIAWGMGRTSNNQLRAIDQLFNLTEKQLNKWGVKYHRLFLGKPAADIYVDDKGIADTDFFDENIL